MCTRFVFISSPISPCTHHMYPYTFPPIFGSIDHQPTKTPEFQFSIYSSLTECQPICRQRRSTNGICIESNRCACIDGYQHVGNVNEWYICHPICNEVENWTNRLDVDKYHTTEGVEHTTSNRYSDKINNHRMTTDKEITIKTQESTTESQNVEAISNESDGWRTTSEYYRINANEPIANIEIHSKNGNITNNGVESAETHVNLGYKFNSHLKPMSKFIVISNHLRFMFAIQFSSTIGLWCFLVATILCGIVYTRRLCCRLIWCIRMWCTPYILIHNIPCALHTVISAKEIQMRQRNANNILVIFLYSK